MKPDVEEADVPALPNTPPLLLTVIQAADQLSIGRSQMYELINSGEVESVKIHNSRRVPRAALVEYIEQLRSKK